MPNEKATPRGPSATLEDVMPAADQCRLEDWTAVRVVTREELDDIFAEQLDSRMHGEAILAANRKIRKVLHARPLDGARAWQHQAGLFTYSGYEDETPGAVERPDARWGVHAEVIEWHPEIREEYRIRRWAPTWREAIAAAVQAVIDEEP